MLRPGFVRRFCSSSARSRSRQQVWTAGENGLFGQGLYSPADYPRLARDVTARMQVLVDRIHRYPASKATLHWMDDLSDEICRLVDPAMIVIEAHESEQWRAAAAEAASIVTRKMEEINADTALGQKLQGLVPDESFSPEDTLLLQKVASDMIPVNTENSGRFIDLQREIAETQDSFAAFADSSNFPLPALLIPREWAKLLPRGVSAHDFKHDRSKVMIRIDGAAAEYILTHCEDEYLRYIAHVASSSYSGMFNLDNFEKLIELRQDLGSFLSHKSFSEMKLVDSLVESPMELVLLMSKILQAAHPKIKSELSELEALKRKHLSEKPSPNQHLMEQALEWQSGLTPEAVSAWTKELSEIPGPLLGRSTDEPSLFKRFNRALRNPPPPVVGTPLPPEKGGLQVALFLPEIDLQVFLPLHRSYASQNSFTESTGVDSPKADPHTDSTSASTIRPWDVRFYTNMARSRAAVNTTGVCSALDPYLSLKHCISGMKIIAEEVFNCRMELEPVDSSCSWTHSPGGHLNECRIFDKSSNELLGLVILDLRARAPKSQGCANYVVQAGRVQREPRQDLDQGVPGPSDFLLTRSQLEGEVTGYQTPVVALLTSLDEKITWEQFIVLFHEFGHALHHVFSTSRYQHHSGLRAEIECAETPSTLLECFVKDPQLVTRFLVHPSTRQPIPEALVQAANAAAAQFAGLELQELVLRALFDILSHANPKEKQQLLEAALAVRPDQNLFVELIPQLSPTGQPVTAKSLPLEADEGLLGADAHISLRLRLGRALSPVQGLPALGDLQHLQAVHLHGYGAQVYSYVLCRIVALSVWGSVFKGRALSKEAGLRWRNQVLAHGGGRVWRELLVGLLAESPESTSCRLNADPSAWWDSVHSKL